MATKKLDLDKKTKAKTKAKKAKPFAIPKVILDLKSEIKKLQNEIERSAKMVNNKQARDESSITEASPEVDITMLSVFETRLREYEGEWEEDLKDEKDGILKIDKAYYHKWSRRGDFFYGKDERVIVALCYSHWANGKSDYECALACRISTASLSRYMDVNPEVRSMRNNLKRNIPKLAEEVLQNSLEHLKSNPHVVNASGQALKVLQATDEDNYGSGRFKQQIDADVEYTMTEDQIREADDFMDDIYDGAEDDTTPRFTQ